MVPQSVHHKYEGKWQGADTKLTTCSSTKGSSVAAGAEAQLVKQGQEVVFTYDVNYRVRGCACFWEGGRGSKGVADGA